MYNKDFQRQSAGNQVQNNNTTTTSSSIAADSKKELKAYLQTQFLNLEDMKSQNGSTKMKKIQKYS